MEKNKTGKYLKYSVGEILLLVIGILIALQINNWNDNRLLVELQKDFILNIKEDLKMDRENLQNIISIQKEKYDYTQRLLNEMPNINQENKKQLDSLMNSILYENPTFFPVIGSYQSALSSGKFARFKGNTVTSDIASLYENYYSRLVYVGEALDDRFFKMGEKYKFERRTKQFREMNEIENSEFQDNIHWLSSIIDFYLKRSNETLTKINEVLVLQLP